MKPAQAVDCRPYIREAIGALGLLNDDAEDTLVELIAADFMLHPTEAARRYRKGEQLSREEKRAAGIRGNAFMSRRAWAQLTEKGRQRPLEAHSATLLRATFSYHRAKSVAAAFGSGHDTFKHSAAFRDCPGCARLDGQESSGAQAQVLPPPDCNRDACALLVDLEIDFSQGLE